MTRDPFPFRDPASEAVALRLTGMTLTAIGKHLECSRPHVAHLLRSAGRRDLTARRSRDLSGQFDDLFMPEPNSGCWLWLGRLGTRGYGAFWDGKKSTRAHRYSYERANGPIPQGLELDHKCRVHCCINPDHLEAVSHQENVRRGITGKVNGARKLAQTHCKNGHPYSGENLIVGQYGYRDCAICAEARNVRRSVRSKAKYHASKIPVL